MSHDSAWFKCHFRSYNISRLRICSVNRQILVGTSFPRHFSKWPPLKNAENKNGNFPISAQNYHRITMFMPMYMFLRVPNTMKLVMNSLLKIQRVKIQDGRQYCKKKTKKIIICWGRVFLYFIDN